MWSCQEDGVKEEMCGKVENSACIINPPNCLMQKCQKLSQFSNFWGLISLATFKKHHQ